MAVVAKRDLQTPKRSNSRSNPKSPSLPPPPPPTPLSATPRRSTRSTSLHFDAAPSPPAKTTLFQDRSQHKRKTPKSTISDVEIPKSDPKSKKSKQKQEEKCSDEAEVFSPVSPERSEKKIDKKRKISLEERTTAAAAEKKRQVYYKKVVYDGGEFEVGDDVYVKRRDDASSDEEVVEVEQCRICFKAGKAVMIECDDCLGGFHLKCLKPPLKEVPEGDWVCAFCEARRSGKEVQLPKPPQGKKLVRTFREKLLSSDLWAARIER